MSGPEGTSALGPMPKSRQPPWIAVALMAGLVYFVIGRFFPNPTENARVWRLLAWLVSGVIFAVHFGYEHFTQRRSPRMTATHVAFGVAVGACALAAAGAVRSMTATSTLQPLWFAALVAWPAITALPAFLVAFVAGSVLDRARTLDSAGEASAE